MTPKYTLTFSCPDVPGIQAAVTTLLFEANAFLEEVASYGDPETKTFFSRIVYSSTDKEIDPKNLSATFAKIAQKFDMKWDIHGFERKTRVVIAVSKFGHCLNDLLHRWSTGTLPVDIVGVISNHDDMRAITEWYKLPYYHLPVTPATKPAQEQLFFEKVEELTTDLVVLARYMQVLSDGLCAKLKGRCINIHHSFLPSFKGARPYHQAHAMGVKIIGATAHYVTPELDEGPIIEQGVERVDHTQTAQQLVHIGQDIECTVLARAVKWHAEHRILRNGRKTVIFR